MAKLWSVWQAEKLGKNGIGLKYSTGAYGALTIFPSQEEAHYWLRNLIMAIKNQQALGQRPANNLIPEESLDFCIIPIEFSIPQESKDIMKGRGWDFEAADAFAVKKDEDEWEKTTLQRIEENMKAFSDRINGKSNKEEQKKYAERGHFRRRTGEMD